MPYIFTRTSPLLLISLLLTYIHAAEIEKIDDGDTVISPGMVGDISNIIEAGKDLDYLNILRDLTDKEYEFIGFSAPSDGYVSVNTYIGYSIGIEGGNGEFGLYVDDKQSKQVQTIKIINCIKGQVYALYLYKAHLIFTGGMKILGIIDLAGGKTYKTDDTSGNFHPATIDYIKKMMSK